MPRISRLRRPQIVPRLRLRRPTPAPVVKPAYIPALNQGNTNDCNLFASAMAMSYALAKAGINATVSPYAEGVGTWTSDGSTRKVLASDGVTYLFRDSRTSMDPALFVGPAAGSFGLPATFYGHWNVERVDGPLHAAQVLWHGMAILAVAADGSVLVQNSWGPDFGKGGRLWMSRAYFDSYAVPGSANTFALIGLV